MPVKSQLVQDDFTGAFSSKWIVDSGTPIGGSGRVEFPTVLDTPNQMHWEDPVDLTNSAIFVSPRPDLGSNTAYQFRMQADENNWAGFVVVGPNPNALRSRLVRTGFPTDSFTDYDSVNHAWWRLRESGGMLYWDVSNNGQTWKNHRAVAHGLDLTSVQIVFWNTAHTLTTGYGGGLYGIGPYGDV